jgi:hypothetical protein
MPVPFRSQLRWEFALRFTSQAAPLFVAVEIADVIPPAEEHTS